MTRSWSIALLLTLIAPLGYGVTHAGNPITPKGPVFAFVGVSVIPMDRERVLENQTVVVQGQQIIALGPTDQIQVPAHAVQIDGHGKYLLPGLADMHVHLEMGGWLGFDVVDDSVAITRALFLFAANGVTTIRDMDYRAETPFLLHWRARVAAGEFWAPRIYTAGKWYVDSTRSVAENVAAYKAAGYDFIKLHETPTMGAPIGSEDSEEEDKKVARRDSIRLDSLVEAARRIGFPVAGHAMGGLDYALKHHYKSVEHLGGFPGLWDSSVDASQLPAYAEATRQAGVLVCPTEALFEDTKEAGYRRSLLPAKEDSALMVLRRRVIKALQDAGAGLLSGTDAPFLGTVPGVSLHHELQTMVRAGLTPYQALLTGTRNVATYFGTEDSTGTIAVGKRADLVLLHKNPLTDIRNSSNIAGVMVAGRWVAQAEIERQMMVYAQGDTAMKLWFNSP